MELGHLLVFGAVVWALRARDARRRRVRYVLRTPAPASAPVAAAPAAPVTAAARAPAAAASPAPKPTAKSKPSPPEVVKTFFAGRQARQASWATIAAFLASAGAPAGDPRAAVEALERLGVGVEPTPEADVAPPEPQAQAMLFLIPDGARRDARAIAGRAAAAPGALATELRHAVELCAAVASAGPASEETDGAAAPTLVGLVDAIRRTPDLAGVARARALALAMASTSAEAHRRVGARFGCMNLPEREAAVAAAGRLARSSPTARQTPDSMIRRRLDRLILEAAAAAPLDFATGAEPLAPQPDEDRNAAAAQGAAGA